MEPIEIIAQIIGIAAMALNVLSFQCKKQRDIITMQLFGACLFVLNYFLLGAITGALTNFIAVLRALVYSNKERFRAEKRIWLVAFIAAFFAAYVATFALFGKEPTAFNLIIELLPTLGVTASTISFSMKDAKSVRRLAPICSCAWLIYNIINKTIGGTLCEIFALVSVIIGMLRHDVKKPSEKNG